MIAYKFIVWGVMLGAGIAGGWLGWWHVSKTLYLRQPGAYIFENATISRTVLMRRQVWRIVMTVAGAVVGTSLGMIALMSLARLQS